MRKGYAALAIFVLVLAGCPNEPAPVDPLYFFGTEVASDGFSHAGYWNSGARTNVPDARTESSDAVLSGSTVYVSGVQKTADEFEYARACRWTDISIYPLGGVPTNDATVSNAAAIRYINGTVYVAGSQFYPMVACYWANSARIDLDGALTCDVFEYGGNVYAFGYYNDTLNWIPCFWTNGASRWGLLTGDGRYLDKGTLDGTWYYLPCKERNGTPPRGGYYLIDLTDFDNTTFVPLTGANVVHTVKVIGGSIYVVGTNSTSGTDVACLWVNGVQQFAESTASEAFDVLQYNGKTYICGIYKDAGLDEFACYWEDGVRYPLSSNAGSSAHTMLLIE